SEATLISMQPLKSSAAMPSPNGITSSYETNFRPQNCDLGLDEELSLVLITGQEGNRLSWLPGEKTNHADS
ncbi:MAG: hypothetical protein V3U59_07090, partial [Gammaproteobacteria bacterium]